MLLQCSIVEEVVWCAGCVGAKFIPSDGIPCGMLTQTQLDRPLTEGTLTYNIKFSKGYDWTAGEIPPPLNIQCLDVNAGELTWFMT